MQRILFILLFCLSALMTVPVWAECDFEMYNNVQFLHGKNYQLGAKERNILIFEHLDKWCYGDTFFLADSIRGDSDDFFQLSPRLSFSKMSGKKLSYGILSDVLIATSFEKTESISSFTKMAGIGFDWAIPHFTYMVSNFMVQDDPNFEGATSHILLAWGVPLSIESQNFWCDGFTHIVGGEGQSRAHQLFVQSFLWDAGHPVGYDNRFYLGTKYQHNHNKFGVANIDEDILQSQFRIVF